MVPVKRCFHLVRAQAIRSFLGEDDLAELPGMGRLEGRGAGVGGLMMRNPLSLIVLGLLLYGQDVGEPLRGPSVVDIGPIWSALPPPS